MILTECKLNLRTSVIRITKKLKVLAADQTLKPSWALLSLGPSRQGCGQAASLLRPEHQGPDALFSPNESGYESALSLAGPEMFDVMTM